MGIDETRNQRARAEIQDSGGGQPLALIDLAAVLFSTHCHDAIAGQQQRGRPRVGERRVDSVDSRGGDQGGAVVGGGSVQGVDLAQAVSFRVSARDGRSGRGLVVDVEDVVADLGGEHQAHHAQRGHAHVQQDHRPDGPSRCEQGRGHDG